MHLPPTDASVTTSVATAQPPAIDMRMARCGAEQTKCWDIAWAQVIGVHHPHVCEDSVAHQCPNQQTVFVSVCDGVGGGARGDVASATASAHAVRMPIALVGNASGIAQWMEQAEAQVQMRLRTVSHARGATTLAAAWLTQQAGVPSYIMRVGDARIYAFDGTHAMPLTQDQTYQSMGLPWADQGAKPDDPAAMIGSDAMGEPEVVPLALPSGSTLLLCSDGLHRGLDAGCMASILIHAPSLEAAALRLVQTARVAGSADDITVLLARPTGPVARTRARTGLLRRLFS
ncbi:PP2C family protein-serine/threonine phosphatase [Curvibacter sp. AEP1-3]|uniref:PP2C family protein-serine/threonine phosphatase n=1 Tax=Curvibacter sp. AEP1-3 TaxID=1844971 RepID=UPI0012F91DB5|nr:protein phosphatase 2C domain-containing protein [Curvibacter sp. AEP1-3]